MDSIRELALQYYSKEYNGVIPPSMTIEKFTDINLDFQVLNPPIFQTFNDLHPFQLSDRILDMGCGVANFSLFVHAKGFLMDGYEIDPTLYRLASLRVEALPSLKGGKPKVFFSNDGTLPIPDGVYDRVVSNLVLEHVNNLDHYFSEAIRVLKPGGILSVVTCNYKFYYEFHYQLFLPLFSRKLSRAVLRMRGRNPAFFDQLNFINPGKIEKILKEKADKNFISFFDFGARDFIKNIANPKLHSPAVVQFSGFARSLGLLSLLASRGYYNPLVYHIIKK